LSDGKEALVYKLAYNDGILDMADRLKAWFEENTSAGEEKDKNGADQRTD